MRIIKYIIHPKIIDIIAHIYEKDKTHVYFNNIHQADSNRRCTSYKQFCIPWCDNTEQEGTPIIQPFLIKHITQLENIQRSFTKHITGMNDMPYHERLNSLGLYSLQRRRERYCIIYGWKIIEDLAYNFSNPTTSTFSGRIGRSCVISNVNVGCVGTLSNNSFRWRSIRLFNSLPMHLRSISSCSVLIFKTQRIDIS